jgi:hypothetical protein
MWHQVTTDLRKSNPARGVLFMGAKIEPASQGGVCIVFSPDSSFAFAAAQKKEVKELLAQTFIKVLGGSVPFELVMGKGQPAQTPQTPQEAQAAPSQPAPAAPAASSVPASAPQSAPSATAAPQAGSGPSAQPPAEYRQPVSTVRYDDESPFWEDEIPIDYQQAPAPDSASVPAFSEASLSKSSASPSVASAAAAASEKPALQPSVPAAAPSNSSGTEALSESEQIKQILTASFGEGVKFDTM